MAAPLPRSARGAVIAMVLCGCAGSATAPASTGTPSAGAESPPRRPPGIAIDPLLGLPAAAASAPVEQGVVVLSAPVDPRPALKVIEAFFDAVMAEAADQLEAVLDRSAVIRPVAKARPEPALHAFRRRFERLDYTSLATELVYRPSEIELHTAREVRARGGPPSPVTPRGDEIVARVQLVRSPSTARYFGGEIVFLLKPDRGTYKIGELLEDFRLP